MGPTPCQTLARDRSGGVRGYSGVASPYRVQESPCINAYKLATQGTTLGLHELTLDHRIG